VWATVNGERGVAHLIAVVLLVAVAVVLGAMTTVFAVSATENTEVPPVASFESETEGDLLVVTHTAGDAVPTERLEVHGGEIVGPVPESLTAGEPVRIEPTAETVELTHLTADRDSSSVLYETAVSPESVGSPGPSPSPFEPLPTGERAQYRYFRNVTVSDPFTLRVTATAPDGTPYTGRDTVQVQVTDHEGGCCDAPETRYYESGVVLDFDEDGTARLVFGNVPSADVSYWGLNVDAITEGVTLNGVDGYDVSLAINGTA